MKPREKENRPVVLVVDDDEAFRKALSRQVGLLGYDVEDYSAPGELLKRAEAGVGDCLLVDLVMPDMTGIELQHELRVRGLVTPAVFLSGRGDIPSSVEAMKAGALDFLEKPVEVDELRSAVAAAVKRSKQRKAQDRAIAEIRRRFARLTERQREVFLGVVAGSPNKVIAYRLGITIRTVKAHRQQIMERLEARSVSDLAWKIHQVRLSGWRR